MYVSKALLYFDYTLIFMLTLCIFILTVNLFKQRLLAKSLQSKLSAKTIDISKSVVIVISYLNQKIYLYDLLQYVGVTLDDKQKGLLERRVQEKSSTGFRGGDNG